LNKNRRRSTHRHQIKSDDNRKGRIDRAIFWGMKRFQLKIGKLGDVTIDDDRSLESFVVQLQLKPMNSGGRKQFGPLERERATPPDG
jgi:hypothetical protein